jgi:ABC-type glutathione transport system ATPase component
MHVSFEIPNSFIDDFDFETPRINSHREKIEFDRDYITSERQMISLEKPKSKMLKDKNIKNCIEYKWENVTVKTKIKKKEKFLLDDISGSVKTGEALAIIGGSGAGNLYK